jgi:hypothetical protein
MWQDTLRQFASEVGFGGDRWEPTEEMLEQSVKALHDTVEILHGLDYPVVRIDPDNALQFMSNAFLHYAEVTVAATRSHIVRSSYVGRDITEFILPDQHHHFERAKAAAKKRRLRATGPDRARRHGVVIELTFVSALGTLTPIRASITYAMHYDTYQISMIDFSELKRYQEDLVRAKSDVEERVEERTAELAAANDLLKKEVQERQRIAAEHNKLIDELRDALAEVKTLEGMIPICAWCRKVRDDSGYWQQVDDYVRERSDVEFSHGICPECSARVKEEAKRDRQRQKELANGARADGHGS